jgi:hypothetical protein
VAEITAENLELKRSELDDFSQVPAQSKIEAIRAAARAHRKMINQQRFTEAA